MRHSIGVKHQGKLKIVNVNNVTLFNIKSTQILVIGLSTFVFFNYFLTRLGYQQCRVIQRRWASHSTQNQQSKLDRLREYIISLFNDEGLSIAIDTNLIDTDFSDVSFNFNTRKYFPFKKPNSTPLYIHLKSNFPQSITKQSLSRKCELCLTEKLRVLNKWTESVSKCRHRNKFQLSNIK